MAMLVITRWYCEINQWAPCHTNYFQFIGSVDEQQCFSENNPHQFAMPHFNTFHLKMAPIPIFYWKQPILQRSQPSVNHQKISSQAVQNSPQKQKTTINCQLPSFMTNLNVRMFKYTNLYFGFPWPARPFKHTLENTDGTGVSYYLRGLVV